MINFVKSEERVAELAAEVWKGVLPEEKIREMVSSICSLGLYPDVLDVNPRSIRYAKGNQYQIVVCQLFGNFIRTATAPVFIPTDEYSYSYEESIFGIDDLKRYAEQIKENPDFVLLLFPSEYYCVLLLERHRRCAPLPED